MMMRVVPLALLVLAAPALAFAASTARTPALSFHAAPAPPNLTAAVRLEEPSGNRALDALEEGAIVVTFENSGRGDAYDVAVVAAWEKAPKGVKLAVRAAVGTVAAGKRAEARLPISADENVPNQSLKLALTFPERAGFDADPVTLAFDTRAFAPPKLAVADFGIDDASGNGQVEPGELVEITARVQNLGLGDAVGVTARVELGDNVSFAEGSSPDHSLGTLLPGQHKDLAFSFYTNKRVQPGQPLPISVILKEGRGRHEAREPLKIAVNAPQRRAQEVRVESVGRAGPGAIERAGGLSVDVDQNIPVGREKNPDAVAVVIGVKNYRRAPAVDFADRDASVVQEYLVKTLGYDPKNVIALTDPTLSDLRQVFGTQGNPRGRLYNFVKSNNSDVFVYYAGHGAPDPASQSAYFVPSDADPNYLASSGYPLDLFWENLGQLPVRSLTVVLDTCFSGNSEKGLLLAGVSPALLKARAELRGPAGSVVMTSAATDQVSTWYPEKRHSMFTYWWLKGLGGAADTDGDRRITVGELEAYVKEHVPYWARRLSNQEQTPVVHGDPARVVAHLK